MINVTKTYLPDEIKYKEYVDKIFQSGWITNNGQFVQQLEKSLKEYLCVKNILLVSNATLGLQVAYKVLNLSGEVLTTPFSFVATTSSMVWEGLKPVFVDIDKDTFNIDYRSIKEKINDNTTCIVPVHVFGNACNIEEIDKIAKEHDLKVIYDAAHAFELKYKDNNILNHGDISILSFHATKIFHTIEGGALIINDDDLYEKAKKMINFGITGPGKIEQLGINAKMNEFQAAMGLCVLDDMEVILRDRKKVYQIYIDAFSNNEKLKLQKHNEACSYNYAYFPLVFETEEKLLIVKKELEKEDIYPRRYFYPSLDTLDYVTSEMMTTSNDIAKRILCLPLYYDLDYEIQKKIIKIIKKQVTI